MTTIGTCVICKNEVEKRENSKQFHLKPVRTELDSTIHNIPFYCPVCGAIKSPLKALRDLVFIYPLYKSSILGEGLLARPTTYEPELSDYGVILSFGPGYYRKSKFVPVKDLQIGMHVVYDKTVPWEVKWTGTDKQEHPIKYMTFLDVKLVPDMRTT